MRGRERHEARWEDIQAWVLTVVFSLDGQLIASGSDDRTVLLWNINKMPEIPSYVTKYRPRLDFSPDGEKASH
jgi:WD40 repeat protein